MSLNREIRKSYRADLKSPEWIAFSEAHKLDHPFCASCDCVDFDLLQVHHKGYREGVRPWQYLDDEVCVVCRQCHEDIHAWADEVWNEVLKTENKWEIYECIKFIRKRLQGADCTSSPSLLHHCSGV
jgi:hypothetical protein